MEAWVIWLIAAVALAVGEMLSLSFFLAPFAVGATVAMLLELAGAPGALTFAAFAVVTGASFAFLRPVARRHLNLPPQLRTGTAALVGRPGIVTERIANDEGVGTVKIDGEVWTARAYDDAIIAEGARVQVIEIRGATALVSE
jgi:membrane protein implicated in regulation of membrane protease activity